MSSDECNGQVQRKKEILNPGGHVHKLYIAIDSIEKECVCDTLGFRQSVRTAYIKRRWPFC